MKNGFVALCMFGFFGCGSLVPADESPVHVSFIGDSVWSSADLLREFDVWENRGVQIPSSSFRVWKREGEEQKLQISIVVPLEWAGSPLREEHAFLTKSRESLVSWLDSPAEPSFSNSLETRRDGACSFHVWLPELEPEVWKTEDWSETKPLHSLFLIDVSGSSFHVEEAQVALQAAFWEHIKKSELVRGSSFELWQIGGSRDTAKRIWFRNSLADTSEKRLVQAFETYISMGSFQFPKAPNASAVLGSINRASTALKEREGRYQLYILSDLREATSDGFHFEGKIPTPDQFLQYAEKNSLISDLSQTEAIALGVHDRKGSKSSSFSADDAKKLKEVWQHMFQAMNVEQLQIFTSPQNAFPKWKFPTEGGSK